MEDATVIRAVVTPELRIIMEKRALAEHITLNELIVGVLEHYFYEVNPDIDA